MIGNLKESIEAHQNQHTRHPDAIKIREILRRNYGFRPDQKWKPLTEGRPDGIWIRNFMQEPE